MELTAPSASRVRAARTSKRIFLGFSILLLAVLAVFLLKRPSFEGDSLHLISEGFTIPGCIAQGMWGTCRSAGQFPLFQLFPAFLMASAGLSQSFTAHAFAYASFASAFGIIWIFRRTLARKDPSLFAIALAILVTGYGVRYVNSTFGEMLAAFLIAAMVGTRLVRERSAAFLVLAFLSSLTKETAFPFIVAFGLLAASLSEKKPRSWIREGAALVSVSGAAVLCQMGLNLFRYGTIFNRSYLQTDNIVHDPSIQLSFFGGIWFSPSGGILFFWTSFFVTLCFALFWSSRAMIRDRLRASTSDWTTLILSGLLFGLTLGFSRWYAPLGWYAWGPRLFLPWLPATLLLILWAHSSRFVQGWRAIARSKAAFGVVAAGLLLTLIPHARVLLRYQWVNRVIESPICPAGSSDQLCTHLRLWPGHWEYLRTLSPAPETREFIGALLLGTVLLWSLLEARRKTVAQPTEDFGSAPHSPAAH